MKFIEIRVDYQGKIHPSVVHEAIDNEWQIKPYQIMWYHDDGYCIVQIEKQIDINDQLEDDIRNRVLSCVGKPMKPSKQELIELEMKRAAALRLGFTVEALELQNKMGQ